MATKISIVTPAANFALTTLDRVKLELDITDTAEDAYLEALIDAASDAAAKYCGRVFPVQEYLESVPGPGDYNLLVTYRPVITVTQVLYDSTPITDVEVANADGGILFRRAGFVWTAPTSSGASDLPVAGRELPLYHVTYTAGYVLPGDGGARTFPQAWEYATVLTVAHWYKAKGKAKGVKTKKVGDFSITYESDQVENAFGIPLKAAGLLPGPKF